MTQEAVPEVGIDDLEAAIASGTQILDVREIDEVLDAHIAGIQHIALGEVVDRLAEVPSEGPLYVVCAAGGRSMQAAEFLRANGVDAINVAGGTKAWVASGKPYRTGPVEQEA